MMLTKRQIAGAIRSHQRRLKQLRRLGYPENHPMVLWHLRQLAALEKQG